MAKKTQNNENVDRYFFVKSESGNQHYAGKSLIAEDGKDVVTLKIKGETYYGYKPKEKSEGEERA